MPFPTTIRAKSAEESQYWRRSHDVKTAHVRFTVCVLVCRGVSWCVLVCPVCAAVGVRRHRQQTIALSIHTTPVGVLGTISSMRRSLQSWSYVSIVCPICWCGTELGTELTQSSSRFSQDQRHVKSSTSPDDEGSSTLADKATNHCMKRPTRGAEARHPTWTVYLKVWVFGNKMVSV